MLNEIQQIASRAELFYSKSQNAASMMNAVALLKAFIHAK
jgi:hypothetical protein